MDVKFPLDNYLRYVERDVGPRAQALPRRLPARRPRRTCKDLAARELRRRRRRHGRLRAAVHPQRAAVRVHPRARRRDRSTTRCASAVVFCSPLTLFAVLALDPPDGRELRSSRARPTRSSSLLGRSAKQWDDVRRQDGQARHADRLSPSAGTTRSSSARGSACSSGRSTRSTPCGTTAAPHARRRDAEVDAEDDGERPLALEA